MVERPAASLSRTAWTLVALVAGIVSGILLHGSTNAWAGRLAAVIGPVGQLWGAALRLMVVPLVITLTLVAVAGTHDHWSIGALGGKTLLLFLAMLVASGLFAMAVTPPLVSLYPVDAGTAAALRGGTPLPAAALQKPSAKPATLAEWLAGLIPGNIVAAASGGEILPILLFTVFFGLAVSHLPAQERDVLVPIFRALADAAMVLIGWVLTLAPLGVFSLAFELAFRAGAPVAGFLIAFVVLVSGIMILFTGLLYPVTALLGRISVLRFAEGVAPAQLVAVSTRSSLAALPALVAGARDRLGLPAAATGFVLPLSVTAFKVNQPISGLVKLLFLAHVFQVRVGLPQMVTFLAIVFVMSVSALGIPGGGSTFRLLPAYLAAGIPIEGIIVLEAVDTIPDIFKTLLNVTGDMSAATILSRSMPREPIA
jgi:Na+/H+-dicarboxylate symporter